MMGRQILYSEKYFDSVFEYRHVFLPIHLAMSIPREGLLTEEECTDLGVRQSPGWVHYMIHGPEPHILLFRRPLTPAVTAAEVAQTAGNSDVQEEEQSQTTDTELTVQAANSLNNNESS